MQFQSLRRSSSQLFGVSAALLSTFVNLLDPTALAAQSAKTATPIKHVIVIIGENRTFDHVFATYKAKAGETVDNLLSREIINEDGTPGPNYSRSAQYKAVDSTIVGNGLYSISPAEKTIYANIPPVLAGGPSSSSELAPNTAAAKALEPGFLANGTYRFLTTGATGIPGGQIDTRIPNVNYLPAGVFQLTPGVKYDAYANSPVHRFYQMWQQLDCNVDYSTERNPSGCLADLFPWVEVTVGAGTNGLPQPAGFNDMTTGEGGTSMEFYNMQRGDAPYLRFLAERYTINDNFHQSVMGGTGANHIMFGYADDIFFSDGKGNAAVPPANQIENPNPQAGTNNWYTEDGYGIGGGAGGGSYSACADATQPGVTAVVDYLQSLTRPMKPNCDPGHYYLLNNYNPAYNADGTLAINNPNPYAPFTIPPTNVRHIGDALMEKNISFKYYGDGWNLNLSDPNYNNPADAYCNICNPFQYAADIMTNATLRQEHIQDLANFYEDVKASELPAVSIIKPSGFVDGHPASSKLDLFEGFTKKVITSVQANPELWESTAIFVTFDEGGGYYDSGYIQPLDFFGDGTRIPLIVVSPFSKGGHVDHKYSDHVSIIKFIERNWNLKPLTARSRDNYPNPKTASDNPYVPLNTPALDDLFNSFDFHADAKQ
jgi:phospholipase C